MSQGVALSVLDDLNAVAPLTDRGEGRFELEIPAGWQQGRGTFGGLTLGLLARAVECLEPPAERPLRSLNATIGGALKPGRAEIAVTARRRGRALSTWAAALIQGGVVVAEALTIHGASRPNSPLGGALRRPDEAVDGWRELPVAPLNGAIGPDFVRHFEFRNLGAAPFQGLHEALTAGFVRPRTSSRRHDTAELIALSDAWWPAPLCAVTAPTPMATVGFQWARYADPSDLVGPDREAPLYHEGRVLAAEDGYFTEERVLFDVRGRLVCLNHQTMAVG